VPLRIGRLTVHLGDDRIRLSSFGRLAEAHLASVAGTADLEERGSELLRRRFPAELTATFVWDVCKWGNYPGIAGRVLKWNTPSDIARVMKSAVRHLPTGAVPGWAGAELRDALRCLNDLPGLGEPSFASKHLRILRPELCPVLDRLIAQSADYAADAEGYAQFARDCFHVASLLQEHKVPNPRARKGKQWYVADVESALFAAVQGWA
jgi:hypothetical protein